MEELRRSKFTAAGEIANERLFEAVLDPDRYPEGTTFIASDLHESHHTYASIAIAAGLNPKTLSSYLGHATITITLDRYGHLMPGSEIEARAMLDT